MGPLTRWWPLRVAALAASVLVIGSTAARSGAETAPELRAHIDALGRSESAALLELYASEASLSRAQADLARLDQRSAELVRAEQAARRQAEIVRRSLAASQQRVAELLRALYVQGPADPIAVILGATSLDEAMAGIDGLSRATALNKRLGSEAEQRARHLVRLRTQLADRRRSLDGARAAAQAGAARLASAAAERRETLSVIRRRRSLTGERLATLESRAQEAEQRSARLAETAATTAVAAATPATTSAGVPTETAASTVPAAAPTGTYTLVVDAVAYHLPGTTASGLPVGVGVIAVDPSVIPLGTRVLIPGYGPAVAADVGSAIKGNIIDLWMPTTAQARAWGRRSVTITVYG